jgi:hypothetical protein
MLFGGEYRKRGREKEVMCWINKDKRKENGRKRKEEGR